MAKTLSLPRLLTLSAITAAVAISASTFAQSTLKQRISIPAGEMLEISIDTTIPQPSFSWILTRDRRFITALRTPLFQLRQMETGTYSLDVNVQNADFSRTESYSFTLEMTPGGSSSGLLRPTPDPAEPPLAQVVTDPPADATGVVHLPQRGGVVKIDASASRGALRSYAIDMDTMTDTGGDGNPENDADNDGSYSEQSGSAIFLLLQPRGFPLRQVAVTVIDEANRTSTGRLNVAFDAADQEPAAASSESILIEKKGMFVQFASAIDPTLASDSQLLHQWNFGDGSESLLEMPSHAYAAPGTYTVTLTVTNIATGQIVLKANTPIDVSEAAIQPSSAKSSVASSQPVQEQPQTGTGNGLQWPWIILAALLVVPLIIGMVFLIAFLRRKMNLGDAFEKMETDIMGKQEVTPESESLAPDTTLKVRRETPSAPEQSAIADRELAKKEFQTQDRPPITPVSASGPVPGWLQSEPAPAAVSAKLKTTALSEPSVTKTSPPEQPKAIPPPLTSQLTPPPAASPMPAMATKSDAEMSSLDEVLSGPVPDWLLNTEPESKPEAPVTTPVRSTEKTAPPVQAPKSSESAMRSAPKISQPPVATAAPAPSPQTPSPKQEITPPQLLTVKPEPTQMKAAAALATVPDWLKPQQPPKVTPVAASQTPPKTPETKTQQTPPKPQTVIPAPVQAKPETTTVKVPTTTPTQPQQKKEAPKPAHPQSENVKPAPTPVAKGQKPAAEKIPNLQPSPTLPTAKSAPAPQRQIPKKGNESKPEPKSPAQGQPIPPADAPIATIRVDSLNENEERTS